MNISFVGTVDELNDFLEYAKECDIRAKRMGKKVVKIFSDFSGFVAE